MSDTALVTLGLVGVAGLVLIPVVMVARFVVAIVLESRRNRAAEARRVTSTVPGLGEFTTTDGEVWLGEVNGLLISLKTHGRPPDETEAGLLRTLVNDLPRYVDSARAYLLSTDAGEALEGNGARLRAYGIDWIDAPNFALELIDPTDDESIYRVEFKDGAPVDWGMDH